MNMRKKIFVFVIMAMVAAIGIAPSFGFRAIQGAVGTVSAASGAALGPVSFRIWSAMPGGTTVFNQNTSSCRNICCMQNYISNALLQPGGYVSNQEATQVYNADLPDQPFYELVDGATNNSGGNHVGYYGVAGVIANNAGVGEFLSAGCPGVRATNCFGRLDGTWAAPPLKACKFGSIDSIGGLNPIPNVDVVVGGTCPAGMACLSANAPQTYAGNMRPNTLPSPVKGVRLYKIFSPTCTNPTGDDPGWTPVGDFGPGPLSTTDPLPVPATGCNFYALKVRVVGPGGDPNELENCFLGVNSCGVGSTQTAVQLVRFNAQYAGHGVVRLSWQSGLEGNVQGFRITRSTSATGPYTVVSNLFRAQGDNHVYQGTDHVPAAARTYYYQLQIIGRDGSITTSSSAGATVTHRAKSSHPKIK